jgi:dihydrodipicolinate synthase/N-acetylneuraminate lyase
MARYRRTILGTCCVPWEADGALAEAIFRDSIRALLSRDLRDLYVFGTAGEGYAVDEGQFDRVVALFAEEMAAAGAAPMVGVISLSLRAIQARIARAAALGVSDFQLALPSWGALDDDELAAFFDETCGRFPACRFLHYNLPRARRLVTPDEYVGLAERHPNLVATKNTASDIAVIDGLLRRAGALRHFLGESGYIYGSLIGEPGLLASIAAIHAGQARALFAAGVARDVDGLRSHQAAVDGLGRALRAAVGAGAHMDGAYDKLFSALRDPRFPLRLLPPYRGAPAAALERFRRAIAADFPAWVEASGGDQPPGDAPGRA